MTSVNELFKKPNLPSAGGSLKRPLPVSSTPDEIYKKSAKHSANGDVKGKQHLAYVEDDDDTPAGPERPPSEGDQDDFNEEQDDDEEGRFFGGGVTRHTADVLDYIDGADGESAVTAEKIDTTWLRRAALSLERRIKKNAELRAKFEDDPAQFMSSEADLDADVKSLSILSEYPNLYSDAVKSGMVEKLTSLLAHDNTDIAIGVVEILSELTDDDVEASEEQWITLVDATLDADLPDLLLSNFDRFDENNDTDRNGVYHALSLLENLASHNKIVNKVMTDGGIFEWLLKRVSRKEPSVSQNKLYATEVLAISVQTSETTRRKALDLDAVDILLQLLSFYRKQDPEKGSNEEEYAENLFNGLNCLVDDAFGKVKFEEAEGVELCLIMLREGKFSKPRALRVLDHATSGQDSQTICVRIVEAAGLKPLLSLFMKLEERESIEHILGIFLSMLRQLHGDSAPRIRLLAKFVEKDFEKLKKLVRLRAEYSDRLSVVERRLRDSQKQARLQTDPDEFEFDRLSQRLDAGLFSYQTIDVILAWLIAEDEGARAMVIKLLANRNESVGDIARTLQEQRNELGDSPIDADAHTIDMLSTLIGFLE